MTFIDIGFQIGTKNTILNAHILSVGFGFAAFYRPDKEFRLPFNVKLWVSYKHKITSLCISKSGVNIKTY